LLGVGVFATRRQRGIPGRLVELILQLLDFGQQHTDDHLRFDWLSGIQFFGDLQCHTLFAVEKSCPAQPISHGFPRSFAASHEIVQREDR
jgi:hypothetical protein